MAKSSAQTKNQITKLIASLPMEHWRVAMDISTLGSLYAIRFETEVTQQDPERQSRLERIDDIEAEMMSIQLDHDTIELFEDLMQ